VRERNEALDCWIYAYAAACKMGMARFGEASWANLELTLGVEPTIAKPVPPTPSIPAPRESPRPGVGVGLKAPLRSRGGGWLGRR
jgi:phage terminase large subunit GpA-like protein